jgi:hypothetical protein
LSGTQSKDAPLEQNLRRPNVRLALGDRDALTSLLIRQYLDVKAWQLI